MIYGKLIQHCSPTLAGMKTANLFSLYFDSEEILTSVVDNLNCELGHKGISFLILLERNRKYGKDVR